MPGGVVAVVVVAVVVDVLTGWNGVSLSSVLLYSQCAWIHIKKSMFRACSEHFRACLEHV